MYIEGFGRVVPHKWPTMSASYLTPIENSPVVARENAATYKSFWCDEGAADYASKQAVFEGGQAAAADGVYVHRLVQPGDDPADGGSDYVVVHTLCLDHLEERGEDGGWRALSWRASMDFLETLLRPPSAAVCMVDYTAAGDLVLFDNLRTMHSVSPRQAYERPRARRVMTRTSLQPKTPLLV